jgi:acyl-CoA hydrolase
MNLLDIKIDPEWLGRMTEKEDGGCVSVGGLVTRIEAMLNLEFRNSFVVMPRHTNYMFPMIFGGAFFAELDLCAAQCVTRLLHDSKTANGAVTYDYQGKFTHGPCYAGEMIFMKAKVVELGDKSIVIEVTAERERRGSPHRDSVAWAKFVFITISYVPDPQSRPDKLPYVDHGLKMP